MVYIFVKFKPIEFNLQYKTDLFLTTSVSYQYTMNLTKLSRLNSIEDLAWLILSNSITFFNLKKKLTFYVQSGNAASNIFFLQSCRIFCTRLNTKSNNKSMSPMYINFIKIYFSGLFWTHFSWFNTHVFLLKIICISISIRYKYIMRSGTTDQGPQLNWMVGTDFFTGRSTWTLYICIQ